MKIFDAHIHALNSEISPENLIEKMNKSGIYGGCVFSNWPVENNSRIGTSFIERMEEVLNWCKGYEDRLFPVMWIHPYEENIIENIRKAADNGICGFKMICNNYYIYEDKCIEVLKEIARLDKPVFFHSGILWDAQVSSNFNRPMNWEALLSIDGLRFSIGHCSWPWIEECVAMYGKFLHAGNTRNDTAEMFFDITPGTPEIHRKKLFELLYTLGYDVGDNIIMGFDCSADTYNNLFVDKWQNIDSGILTELGLSKENLEKLRYKNLLRFLGKTETKIQHFLPKADKPETWRCDNPDVYKTIEEFYKLLGFPKEYDDEFYEALSEIKISDATEINSYDFNCKDGKRNLLSYLYMLKDMEEKYEEKGIPDEIFLDTARDIVTWTKTWTYLKGELYLGELAWLSNPFKMKLFRLGRLQFCMGQAEVDLPEKGIVKGDNVMEVHIPEGSPLTPEECEASVERAKEFFEKYYPQFEYKYFTCHSWLMDDTLKEILSENSNMIKFQNMFELYHKEESDDILKYVFKWSTRRSNLRFEVPFSSFAEKVKKLAMSGKAFYAALGVLEK